MTGTVKFYTSNRGYGFIAGEDGQDHFFHFSSLDANLRGGDRIFIQAGDRVSFQIEPGQDGKTRAGKVQKL